MPEDVAAWAWALRRIGLRATPQRLAVLAALEALPHPDADSVWAAVQQSHPSVSLATVYNTLERLGEAGLIQALRVGERRRYDARPDPHYHLYCRRCQTLVDIDPGWAPQPGPPGAGWQVERVAVTWIGLCPRCRGLEDKAPPSGEAAGPLRTDS